MSELKNLLLEYENINDKLIKILSKDLEDSNYDNIQPLLSEKQQIINSINVLNYTTEEFSSISKELNIPPSEELLNKLFIEKKELLKEKLIALKQSKAANNEYHSNFYRNIYFINDKA
ncbi:hypothetical protein [Clostridium sp. UBA6640]|uniref:hypothetical protein n=1 Tax=Clostridium sp. UBA6640 TaxID=1946370 RepID=UPI0025C61C66|nr:hypothetical protein [Clostridium sp. UBA6640]